MRTPARPRRPLRRTPGRVLVDAVRAETAKLVTLPATWLTVAGTVAVTPLLVVALAAADDPGAPGIAPTPYTQVGFLVLGAVAACGEYVGGQVRTTLTAVPRRVVQRVAAAAALTVVAFPAAVLVVAAGVVTGTVVGDGPGPGPGAVAGAVGHLTLMALLASGVGTLLRRSLPTVGLLLGGVLVVGPLLRRVAVARYLPDAAAQALWSPTPASLPVGVAWVVTTAWAGAALGAAAVVHRRRDA